MGNGVAVETVGVVKGDAGEYAEGNWAFEFESLDDCMGIGVQLSRLKVLYRQRLER